MSSLWKIGYCPVPGVPNKEILLYRLIDKTMTLPRGITIIHFKKKRTKIKIKKLCLTSRFETDNINSVELLLRHNE